MLRLFAVVFFAVLVCAAQDNTNSGARNNDDRSSDNRNSDSPNNNQAANSNVQGQGQAQGQSQAQGQGKEITVPAGTTVLVQLKSPLNTKSAHPGDGVYAETSFPVTIDNTMVIPAYTYVKGSITHVQRPGRVKGRAEILVHFTTLIYPSGYTVDLPGSVQDAPGADNHTVSDKEGTIKANGTKGKDAAEVAATAGTGAAIGGLATGTLKGAAIGGGAGAVVGLAKVLLTRGNDVTLPAGTSLEMVLQRPLTLDVAQAEQAAREVRPRRGNVRMPVPR